MKVILNWDEHTGAVTDHSSNYLFSCSDLTDCELILSKPQPEYSCSQLQEELKALAIAGHTPKNIIINFAVGDLEKTTEYVF